MTDDQLTSTRQPASEHSEEDRTREAGLLGDLLAAAMAPAFLPKLLVEQVAAVDVAPPDLELSHGQLSEMSSDVIISELFPPERFVAAGPQEMQPKSGEISAVAADSPKRGESLPPSSAGELGVSLPDLYDLQPVGRAIDDQPGAMPIKGEGVAQRLELIAADIPQPASVLGDGQAVEYWASGGQNIQGDRDIAETRGASIVQQPAVLVSDEGRSSAFLKTNSRSASEQLVSLRIPIRLGTVHSPRTDLGSDTQATELTAAATERVTIDTDGMLAADLSTVDRQPVTDDETQQSKPRRDLMGDQLVYIEMPSGHPLPAQVEKTVGQPTGTPLRTQLESFLLQVKDLSHVNGETTKMQMTLEPRELGRLEMHISMENGLVKARFDAESYVVKQLIEAELPRLRDALQQQGIHLDQVSVQVGGGQAHGFAERQMRERPSGGSHRQRRDRLPVSTALATSSQAIGYPRAKLGHSFDYIV